MNPTFYFIFYEKEKRGKKMNRIYERIIIFRFQSHHCPSKTLTSTNIMVTTQSQEFFSRLCMQGYVRTKECKAPGAKVLKVFTRQRVIVFLKSENVNA